MKIYIKEFDEYMSKFLDNLKIGIESFYDRNKHQHGLSRDILYFYIGTYSGIGFYVENNHDNAEYTITNKRVCINLTRNWGDDNFVDLEIDLTYEDIIKIREMIKEYVKENYNFIRKHIIEYKMNEWEEREISKVEILEILEGILF